MNGLFVISYNPYLFIVVFNKSSAIAKIFLRATSVFNDLNIVHTKKKI